MSDRPPLPAEYPALVDRVDAFGARVEAAQRPWLRCAAGCDACCRQRRTAFPVEVEAVRRWLADRPPALREALRARRTDPEVVAGRRCVYLDAAGRCDIYPARPLLCRTHGPAVRAEASGVMFCGLNFEGLAAAEVEALLPADAILNLDLLNRMLVLIDRKFRADAAAAAPAPAGPARPPLPDRQDLEEALDP